MGRSTGSRGEGLKADVPGPSNTSRSRRLTSSGPALGRVALIAASVAVVLAFTAPPDALQGQSQRLMYVHVPAAWTSFVAFTVVALASTIVLLGGGAHWDARARAAAELGVGMTGLALAEGSMWGKVAWGVWWTWDPRLVSTALLFLVYVAYLALHALPGDGDRVRRRAALLGAAGFVLVPVVHFSVLWWRTLHQPPTLLRPEFDAPIAAPMLAALLASLAAFTLGGAWYVRSRTGQLVPSTPPNPPLPPNPSHVSTAIDPALAMSGRETAPSAMVRES
jgi:heme exporter protein C